jgi:excisionase family DNA binding protein
MQTVLITLNELDLQALLRNTIEEVLSKTTQPATDKATHSDRLLSIEEVCTLLKISKPTLHNWKREGRLPFHRMGAKVYFKEAEVMEAMKSVKLRR